MRPLRYSISVTLDGCCDHRVMIPDEDMHRHAAENIARADALLLGRVTYEIMETGWRCGMSRDDSPSFDRAASGDLAVWHLVCETALPDNSFKAPPLRCAGRFRR